jgi:hypothetical protein
MGTPQDNYSYWGPSYSFVDSIPTPASLGVRNDGSIGAIVDSVSSVATYSDIIAFGQPALFDKSSIQPMGIRYFLNTGLMCSNGATMSQYFDGVTKGNLLGQSVENALTSAGLPGMRGLAPGMLENARDALDPRPIFAAVTGTGYPVCQQVICPVGDINGALSNPNDTGAGPYIIDPTQPGPGGLQVQVRLVQAYDNTGSPINITKAEFTATPKCYNADGTYMANPPSGCPPTEPAQSATGGQDPYELCSILQTAVMPPTLQSSQGGGSEGFRGSVEGDAIERWGPLIAMGILAGVGMWATMRK